MDENLGPFVSGYCAAFLMPGEIDEDFPVDLFQEPPGFRPPPPQATDHTFECKDHRLLSVKLLGHHSLWAHCLWNAGVWLARHIDLNHHLVRDRSVLEFGAAGGLPSLVSCLSGASVTVQTDYPDKCLIDMMKANVDANVPKSLASKIHSLGFLWGEDVQELLQKSPHGRGYDVIIMSDLIFNHTYHRHLLLSARQCLSDEKDSQIWVPFSHHRPHLADKDMAFFTLAEEMGFSVEKQESAKMKAMFEKDPGSLEVRETVHFYILKAR